MVTRSTLPTTTSVPSHSHSRSPFYGPNKSLRIYVWLILVIIAGIIVFVGSPVPETYFTRPNSYSSISTLPSLDKSPENGEEIFNFAETSTHQGTTKQQSPEATSIGEESASAYHQNITDSLSAKLNDPASSFDQGSAPSSNPHYKLFMLIISAEEAVLRRKTIRRTYFGIMDNLQPCMRPNADVHYKFLINSHGFVNYKIYDPEYPKIKDRVLRAYQAERIEYDDIIDYTRKPGKSLDGMMTWVKKYAETNNFTFDHLLITEQNTWVHLSKVLQELEDGVVGMDTEDPAAIYSEKWDNILWTSFKGESIDLRFWVVGRSGLQFITQRPKYPYGPKELIDILSLKPTNDKNVTSKGLALKAFYDSNAENLDDSLLSAFPQFFNDSHRIREWENAVERINSADLAIYNVYLDSDFEAINRWKHNHLVTTCYPLPSRFHGEIPLNDEDEDSSGPDHSSDWITGDSHSTTSSLKELPPLIAIATSSFIYEDMCMYYAAYPAAQNKREYALKHGYSLVGRGEEFAQQSPGFRSPHRRTVWGKIDAIEKVLPKYDWVFWVDMDAIIIRNDISLESLLQLYATQSSVSFSQIHLIISQPSQDQMPNAGIFFIRNSDWSYRLLRAVQARIDLAYARGGYEQLALWETIQQEEFSDGALILKGDHHFNTFPNRFSSIHGQEEGLDFAIHFAPAFCPGPSILRSLTALDQYRKGQTNSSELVEAIRNEANMGKKGEEQEGINHEEMDEDIDQK